MRGDYFMFVDSDDAIETYIIEDAVRCFFTASLRRYGGFWLEKDF